MLNKVFLIGNLGKDPEVKHLDSGSMVANFTLATNEGYRDKDSGAWIDKVEWHSIVAWKALAEKCSKLSKGDRVFIEGKNQTKKYTDNQMIERYRTEVMATRITSLERKEP